MSPLSSVLYQESSLKIFPARKMMSHSFFFFSLAYKLVIMAEPEQTHSSLQMLGGALSGLTVGTSPATGGEG